MIIYHAYFYLRKNEYKYHADKELVLQRHRTHARVATHTNRIACAHTTQTTHQTSSQVRTTTVLNNVFINYILNIT